MRNWLIKRLVGKNLVICNAVIDPRADNIVSNRFESRKAFVYGCNFINHPQGLLRVDNQEFR